MTVEEETLGTLAYNTYIDWAEGQDSEADAWDDLAADVKKAWIETAKAVLEHRGGMAKG